MRLIYSFRIDKNDKVYSELEAMSKVSKDLYNQALFEVKKQKETGKTLSYIELDRIMKTKVNLDGNINYRLLPAKVAQQTLMLLDQNVKSFFKALADYKEYPQKYQACPQFPHYLPKDGHFVLVFTNQQAKINPNGIIRLSGQSKHFRPLKKDILVSIPEKEFEKYKQHFILFRQVRVVPKFNGFFFNVEIIYDKEELNKDLDVNRVASLDLGVNNLITLVDNNMGKENREPIIINGKPIKSINQFYNKKRAEIQSELAKTNQRTSKACPGCGAYRRELMGITDWRNEKISDYMHKTSRFVINYCLDNKIGHIVIGKNSGWKKEINIGKRNNQNFVSIPFDRLIQQIQYKAQLVGIEVTIQEESYTSKCSALDLEEIGKHENHAYAGKRVKRGLFRTALGLLINADVNGALNILRKVIGDTFLKPVAEVAKTSEKVARLIPSSGYLCYPFKVCF